MLMFEFKGINICVKSCNDFDNGSSFFKKKGGGNITLEKTKKKS